MRIGTKSVLFGAHCFLVHPIFVFGAWWKLYGFPWDPRLWLCFFLHDLGYFGKPNMDGPEGEKHVEWAANLMGRLFGQPWHDLCLYHSRFYAKRDNHPFSRLCVADKYSVCLEPAWFYLLRVSLSGEVHEYMARAQNGKYSSMQIGTSTKRIWFDGMVDYLTSWVFIHRDGRDDTWTPGYSDNVG